MLAMGTVLVPWVSMYQRGDTVPIPDLSICPPRSVSPFANTARGEPRRELEVLIYLDNTSPPLEGHTFQIDLSTYIRERRLKWLIR